MFFNKLIIAVDDSAPSQYAIEVGLGIAQRDQCPVVFAIVLDQAILAQNYGFSSISQLAQKIADGLLESALQQAKNSGVRASSKVLFSEPMKGIIDVALAESAGMIVMGTHGRTGIARVLTRSIAEDVMRHTKTPICVVRRPAFGKPHQKILVPIVNDALGRLATHYAVELAQNFDLSLMFVTVADRAETSAASEFLDEVRAYASKNSVRSDGVILEGNRPIYEAIQDHAEAQNADAIVMASHARDGFLRLIDGSVTEAVIRTSLLPIVVVSRQQGSVE